jgi:hypothetical protein
MPIEVSCNHCGKTLRVGDEHAGGQARCPLCNTVFTVPGGAPATVPAEHWYLKTPEGQVYGPVPKSELDRWLHDGRVATDCQLRCGDPGAWQPAEELYPVLKPGSPSQPLNPFADGSVAAREGGTATVLADPASFLTPHRGPLVLVLGILGWVFSCPVFSVIAWVLGSSDLREMREGRMDPGGQGLVQAGHILGVIYTLLWIAILAIFLFVVVLVAALSN